MTSYQVTDERTGLSVSPGQQVTSFNGHVGIFAGVTRGPEYNGTALVLINGAEYYAPAWRLTVTQKGQ